MKAVDQPESLKGWRRWSLIRWMPRFQRGIAHVELCFWAPRTVTFRGRSPSTEAETRQIMLFVVFCVWHFVAEIHPKPGLSLVLAWECLLRRETDNELFLLWPLINTKLHSFNKRCSFHSAFWESRAPFRINFNNILAGKSAFSMKFP